MKWKEVYAKCNNKKYSRILDIKAPLTIKSNMKNFFKNNTISIVCVVLVTIILLAYTFRNNIPLLFCSIGLFLALFIFLIINSTYKLSLKDSTLELFINFQKYEIEFDSLANIYVERKKNLFLGIPIYSYYLNIIYFENQNPMITSLSTIMLDKKELVNFFNNIQTEQLEQQKEFEREEEENKQAKKAIIITSIIVFVIAIIIFGIVIYLKQK